ncbi:MAG: transporter substrate-binding domain-containing protein, partial [Synergistaceae bacterium]
MRCRVVCHKTICLFLAAWAVLLGTLLFPQSLDAEEKVLRVGWYAQPGYMEIHKGGALYGYNYEYLQKIAQVNGWRYVFVQGTFEGLIKKLSRGEIDILGCIFYSKERESLFDFPNYNVGKDYLALFTSVGSSLSQNDFKSFNGIKVGGTTENNLLRFKEFAAENNFKASTSLYPSFKQLTDAVDNGSIDAAVYGGFQPDPAYKSIASFAPSSFYFVTTKGNKKVLAGLNRALSSIKLYNPYYDRDLAKRYLPREYARFSMTESEKEFVASSPAILVSHGSGWPPFEVINEKTGEYEGICRDLLDKVSEITGLKFKYCRTSNADSADKEASISTSIVNDFAEA